MSLPGVPVAAEAPVAEAGVLTGAELLQACTGSQPAETQLCMTFVVGLVQTVAVLQEQNPAERIFCIDVQKVGPEEVRDRAVNWLRVNEGRLNEEAYVLVNEALHHAYPCTASGV
jgi:hypothetical protein